MADKHGIAVTAESGCKDPHMNAVVDTATATVVATRGIPVVLVQAGTMPGSKIPTSDPAA